MIRVFSRYQGDNVSPEARLILPTTYGSGQVFIPLGARPSSATVSFARMFDEKQQVLNSWEDTLGDDEHDDPVVFIAYWNSYTESYEDGFTDLGFWLQYRNIPQYDDNMNVLGIDIHYLAEY